MNNLFTNWLKRALWALWNHNYRTPHRQMPIVIPPNREKILKNSDSLWISYETIFPDLEAVCKYINWKANQFWGNEEYLKSWENLSL